MFRHYLKTAVRNMRRHKGYSFINIAGLAAGVAVSLFALLFALDELGYDRFHEKADRIFRVAQNIHIENRVDTALPTPPLLAETLVRDFAGVEAAARVYKAGIVIARIGDNGFEEVNVYAADAAFFDVFSFKLREGDPKTALSGPNKVILTPAVSWKYFGLEKPLGRTLRIGRDEFTVTGIADTPPRNSHFHFDFLTSLSTYPRSKRTEWILGFCATYVLLRRGYDPAELEAEFPAFVSRYMFGGKSGNDVFKNWEYYLQPLTGIHLDSHLLIGEFEPNGNRVYVSVFLVLAAFILLIACINFINLSTARADLRAREVGIRKVVGSRRSQLVRQFLGESLLFSSIAFAAAFVLIILFMPAFRALSGKAVGLGTVANPVVGACFLLAALLVGLGSGLYPAFLLSSFKPQTTLKRAARRGGKNLGPILRKGLVVVQFAVSIFLFIGTGIIYKQAKHFQNIRLGYDKENVIIVRKGNLLGGQGRAFKEALLRHPAVQGVTNCSSVPTWDFLNLNWCIPQGGEGVVLETIFCDQDFRETLKLEMTRGRFFSSEQGRDVQAVIINDETARSLEWAEPIGKTINVEGKDHTVIGVIRDFHFYSLHKAIPKMAFLYDPGNQTDSLDLFAVRIKPGDPGEVLAFLKKTWSSFSPPLGLDYRFLDENYDSLYRAEARMQKTAAIASSLAILISSLGLLGMVSFRAERRRREIGIRKVLGASLPGVVRLLLAETLLCVLAANVLAWPAAYWIMRKWLQNFAFRVDQGLGIFIMAMGLALVVAVAAVGTKAVRAALDDPVDALRYE